MVEFAKRPAVFAVEDPGALEELKEDWQSFQWHPNADWAQYNSALRMLPGVVGPYAVCVLRGGKPQCIVAGRLEKNRIDLRVGYGNLLRPRLTSMVFIHGGVLGVLDSGSADALVDYVLARLRGKTADLAFFNHLRTDCPLYASITRIAKGFSRDRFPVIQVHRAMTVAESSEEFWQRLSPKVRKNLRWQARRLQNEFKGKVAIRLFASCSEVETMIRDVESIARTTYQRGLGAGFADTSEMRQRLHLHAGNGWLRTYVLYLEGRPCAFWSGTLYQGTFHSDFMGYDAAYGKYSPGMYLIVSVIEEFCRARGSFRMADSIDFGLGDAQYKEVLADTHWEEASVYLFAPTLRGYMVNAVRTPLAFMDQWTRKALERTGLIGGVKRVWRRSLRQG